jgi:hypothetical protein
MSSPHLRAVLEYNDRAVLLSEFEVRPAILVQVDCMYAAGISGHERNVRVARTVKMNSASQRHKNSPLSSAGYLLLGIQRLDVLMLFVAVSRQLRSS